MPGKKSAKPRIDVSFTREEYAALKRYCAIHERGPTWVVRQALKAMGVFAAAGDSQPVALHLDGTPAAALSRKGDA